MSATYTGDLAITLNIDSDWDITYLNGQPEMTDSFDTSVILSVFGEPDFWQNDLTNNPAEKYISDFPAVIRDGRVSNKTLNDGTAAIKRALKWMIDISAAEKVEVTGEVLNVFGLGWTVEIFRGQIVSRFEIFIIYQRFNRFSCLVYYRKTYSI